MHLQQARPGRICCPWCWTPPFVFSGNVFGLPKEYKAIFQIVCYLERKWNLHAQKLTLRSIGVDHVIDLQAKWSIIDPTEYWAHLRVEWIEPLRPAESSSSEAVWYVFEAEKLSEVSMLQCWDSSCSAVSHAVPVRWLCFGLIHTVRMKVWLPLFCAPVHSSIHQRLIGLEASTSPVWQTGSLYPLQDISDTTQRQAFQTTL